jgi:LCP family protein required for cell wall assembly
VVNASQTTTPALPSPAPPSLTPTPVPATAVSLLAPSATPEATDPPLTPPPCVPPADWGIHVVQSGNTLFSLAQRYSTGVELLMQVNCLNTHTIFVGQRLYVPGSLATPVLQLPPTPTGTAVLSTPWPNATSVLSAEGVLKAKPSPTLTPMPALPVKIPDRYLNIVLLGSDRRPGSGAWRTDSMIIVSVDTTDNIVRLLSLPRDLWVYIPGHGYNRINTADLWGELAKKGTGPERVKQTIHHNLGIPIHYYVRIDFKGFIKIIDTVGGIDVDVDCPLPDIKLSSGMHHMSGRQALRYARSRYSTNDFDRGRRQRKVLMALWDQALSLNIIPRLPELWWTMANSFQTDLSLDQVINLAYVGTQLKPQHILSRAIGASLVQSWMTPQGAAVLLPRNEQIRTMLEKYYAPLDPSRLDTVDTVRIQVLNGSPRQDAEQLAASTLRWAGTKVTRTGLADRQDYARSQIAVYTGNLVAAEEIASQLSLPLAAIQDLTDSQEQPDPGNPIDLQIILGRDYDPCQR